MNINSEIKGKIDNIITKNGEIVILAYSLLEKIESIIEYIISKSLNLKEKSFLFTPIISCIKELTTNAIKANIKNILIKEKVVKDPNDPMSLIEAIKKILHERTMLEYSIKCKKYNLTSRIYLKITNKNLLIRVINPLPVSQSELDRINKKIKTAYSYESLAQIYIENPDPMAEGMGLGLSMIIVLLKGINIDPINFKISTDGKNKTTAAITIPF